MIERVRAVPAPAPVLDRDREARLTERQREILDELGRIFEQGFLEVTMADLAAQLNCSLRTLYQLAESRNELVLMVSDRNLRKIGRAAHAAITDDMSALDAVRAYLGAATMAVSDITPEFVNDMEAMASGKAMELAHSEYLVDVTRALLDIAVERGEIAPVDTAATARMIASLGREFSRLEVMADLASSPKEAADAMVDIVLTGLKTRTLQDPPTSWLTGERP
jgi:AcrR family transcriptional regulator